MKRLKKYIVWIYHFLTHDIWHIRLEDLPKAKSFLLKQLRIIVIAFRGFKEDECPLRASALTYYALMSIVPIFAMAFAIAKGFGFEQMLEEQITKNFTGEKEIIETVLGFANKLIEETQGGLIAGIGLIILIWSVMEMFGEMEESFNEIWEQKESRSFIRKFSDYFAIMLIAPILIILSSSATVFVSSTVNSMSNEYAIIGYVGPFISFLLNWTPFFIAWFLFTMLYMVIPNTKVKFTSALYGGVIAGTIYQLAQMGYIVLQLELIDINAVYGSFAALPLLFVWLRVSWISLLLGVEISYAHQNVHKFQYDIDISQISGYNKRLLSLLITHHLIKNFAKGLKPLTDAELSQHLAVPVRVIRRILYDLVGCGILSELKTQNEKETAYQPATDIHKMTIQYVVEKLDEHCEVDVKIHSSQALKDISESMKTFTETIAQSSSNKLLMEI
ncbi:MAG TPA: YihY/virulence factor BrkB family protein [Bacteroidales bacterium]|nr:YihY/virulence factor BrkB family protein [Bacteroidales bacterium]HPS16942.1 YihY/virulence factor BrkB family protein [Bacteroidales bacterium]